jgi:hypothetical protein
MLRWERQTKGKKEYTGNRKQTYPNALMYPNVLNITHQQEITANQAFNPPSAKVGGFGAGALAGSFSPSVFIL